MMLFSTCFNKTARDSLIVKITRHIERLIIQRDSMPDSLDTITSFDDTRDKNHLQIKIDCLIAAKTLISIPLNSVPEKGSSPSLTALSTLIQECVTNETQYEQVFIQKKDESNNLGSQELYLVQALQHRKKNNFIPSPLAPSSQTRQLIEQAIELLKDDSRHLSHRHSAPTERHVPPLDIKERCHSV